MDIQTGTAKRVFVGRGTVELRIRTKAYALRIIRLYTSLPKTTEAQVIGKQILRSGTSVGAQYREANRAKSDADFVSKVQGALQELEETMYWLELLAEANIMDVIKLNPLLDESEELLRVFVSMIDHIKCKTQN